MIGQKRRLRNPRTNCFTSKNHSVQRNEKEDDDNLIYTSRDTRRLLRSTNLLTTPIPFDPKDRTRMSNPLEEGPAVGVYPLDDHQSQDDGTERETRSRLCKIVSPNSDSSPHPGC